jgi:hypothetical protein
LCPPEKELPERRSGAFHHKNTPAQSYVTTGKTMNVRSMGVDGVVKKRGETATIFQAILNSLYIQAYLLIL